MRLSLGIKARPAQIGTMLRMVTVLCLCGLLAGCAGGPQSLGITGPGPTGATTPQPYVAADPAESVESLGNAARYAPNMVPTTGGGRYWGYN